MSMPAVAMPPDDIDGCTEVYFDARCMFCGGSTNRMRIEERGLVCAGCDADDDFMKVGGKRRGQHVFYDRPIVRWYGISGGNGMRPWFIGVTRYADQRRKDEPLTAAALSRAKGGDGA